MSIKKTFSLCVVSICLFCFVPSSIIAGEEISFSTIVAFGDSMSDNGIDDGHGFTRKSNGKTWVEYLGDLLHCKHIENRAWCGAMSGMGNYSSAAKDWSGLQWQVDQYRHNDMESDHILYTLQIGTNDLHDPNKKINPEKVVHNLLSAVEKLAAKGGRYFLLWNLPTSVVSPGYTDQKYEWYSYYNPLLEAALEQYRKFNSTLNKQLIELKEKHAGLSIKLFDIDSFMTIVKNNFENTTTPWYNSYIFPEKGKYFWYDHWHYMTEVHQYIAQEAYRQLKQ